MDLYTLYDGCHIEVNMQHQVQIKFQQVGQADKPILVSLITVAVIKRSYPFNENEVKTNLLLALRLCKNTELS